jgi:hypothetical protein
MAQWDCRRGNCGRKNRSCNEAGIPRACRLTGKGGVLDVRLTARQGQATLDTVATPVQNLLVFEYGAMQGTASNGQESGGNLYPAPTLQVFPGERLIVHFENGLSGLTIRDYYSPQYAPTGQSVPLSSPINLITLSSGELPQRPCWKL